MLDLNYLGLSLFTAINRTVYNYSIYNLCFLLYYIIITIVRSYTGKYHEFVAVCIVTSAQHE